MVFKQGLSEEQIREAIRRLDDVLDNSFFIGDEPPIESFDPRSGGPVFYIP